MKGVRPFVKSKNNFAFKLLLEDYLSLFFFRKQLPRFHLDFKFEQTF